MNKISNNRCNAISNKNQQCKNKHLKFSPYCLHHQPKVIPILTLLLGGFIGLIMNVTWNEIFPPKAEKRRGDVVERISIEASGAIKYTDLFLLEYLNATGKKNLLNKTENYLLDVDSLFFNSELDKGLESIFQNKKMLEGSNSYNSNGKQIAYIANLLWNLKNTRIALDDFLNKYGSVDHEIVTKVTKMINMADVVIMILDYEFKNPKGLIKKFDEGQMDQFADFLSVYYFHQIECKTLINQELIKRR